MKFTHPYLLNLLWALIPLFGIMAYGILERKKILSRFAQAGMWAAIVPGYDPSRQWIKAALITLAAGCMVVALAGPQWGYRWETVNEKGVDLMIALDCSKSMLAGDIQPDRLERAKREIVDLLRMMKSDRAGLVAFSGRAMLQCPLTLDHEAFHLFLKVLTPGFLPVGGTNLSEALKTAYDGFEKESDTEKAVILITDGENTEGDAEETAKTLAKEGIRIFCIGVGGSEGAPIPDENGGFKKDASGNIVLSRVDEKGLEKLATLTNGAYVRSVAGDMDLDLIYRDKIRGQMEGKTLTSGKQKVWENRFQWFLFPGLVLLLAEAMLAPGRRSLNVTLIIPALGLALWGLSPETAQAGIFSSSVGKGITAYEAKDYTEAKKQFIEAQIENPDDKRLYYNIGTAAYMNKEYEEALGLFAKALDAEDAGLRHNARFNLGNTHFQMGNMDGAIKEYEAVLKEFPDDQEARENLEMARQKKQEEKSESGENKDKEKQDQDKDKPKDQENEAPQNEKQGDKDQKNDSGKDQGRDPDKRQGQQDKGQDQGKPETPPEPGRENPQHNEGPSPQAQAGQEQQAGESLDNMLNRLEDKPGGAMIPFLQENRIEKDW
ncbi:MAG: VWA domain-containing protein [Desulfobacteraceae bacterium]|nr:VWA domain-containing protein [Desulfobacteraceae bacterium]